MVGDQSGCGGAVARLKELGSQAGFCLLVKSDIRWWSRRTAWRSFGWFHAFRDICGDVRGFLRIRRSRTRRERCF